MRYRMLSFLCIATAIAYIQRSAFNGTTAAIERDLNVGPREMGTTMGAWYLAYALFQLPSGWVADRFGSTRALLFFATLWSALTGMVGLASGWMGLLAIWVPMGALQAGIFPCCTKAIGATFPRTEQAFASGMLTCFMSLGGAIAPAITSELLGPLPWQTIFALYAVPGLVWASAFAALLPRIQDARTPVPALEVQSATHRSAEPLGYEPLRWSKLLSQPQMLLLCLQQFFRAGAVVLFYTWFARVLMESRELTQATAASLAFWPPLAGAFGGMLGGLFSDWVLRRTGNSRLARQGMTFSVLAIGSLAALIAFSVRDPKSAVFLMSIAAFCGMAGGVSGYSLSISFGGTRVATVFATVNMSGNIGASLFPIAVGWVVALTGNWNCVLLLFAGMFAASAACWAILNPKGTLFREA